MDFFLTEPDMHDYKRRGILILYKKNLNIKVAKIEQINYNLVKIELEHNVMKMSIYGCYAPSDGNNYEYFLDLRRRTLEDENDEILLIGDMNTTLCHVMDRWNYQTDNHRKSRAVINNWISEGEFVDTYRAFHPETESYTFRKRLRGRLRILLQNVSGGRHFSFRSLPPA